MKAKLSGLTKVEVIEVALWKTPNGAELETEDRYMVEVETENHLEAKLKVREMYVENKIYPDSECPYLTTDKDCDWWERSETNIKHFPYQPNTDDENIEFLSSEISYEVLESKTLGSKKGEREGGNIKGGESEGFKY